MKQIVYILGDHKPDNIADNRDAITKALIEFCNVYEVIIANPTGTMTDKFVQVGDKFVVNPELILKARKARLKALRKLADELNFKSDKKWAQIYKLMQPDEECFVTVKGKDVNVVYLSDVDAAGSLFAVGYCVVED